MLTVRTGPRAARRGRAAAPSHLDALDGLRAAAAAAVLLTHVGAMTGYTLADNGPGSWAASRGDIGVPVFFVLSGLLLYRPWAATALTGQPGPRGNDVPAAPRAADPARLLGRRPDRPAVAQPGPGPSRLAVVPVPAAAAELRPSPLVGRNRGHRAGPDVEPGRRGVVLPRSAGARGGSHLVRLPGRGTRRRRAEPPGPAAAGRHRRPGGGVLRLDGTGVLPSSRTVVRDDPAAAADLVRRGDGPRHRLGMGRR